MPSMTITASATRRKQPIQHAYTHTCIHAAAADYINGGGDDAFNVGLQCKKELYL